MAKPTINSDQWPLLVVIWQPEVTLEEIDAHFDEMAEYARRGEVFAVVMDGRRGQKLDPTHRKRAAERLKGLAEFARIAGVAYILDSSLARGVLTALNWLFPPPFETKVFADFQEASVWAKGRLRMVA